MSSLWFWAALVGGLSLALVRSRRALQQQGALLVTNHAGRAVPVILGRVLVFSANWSLLVSLMLALLAGPVPRWRVPLLALVGSQLLQYVGAVDDRSSAEIRGLGAHLRSLLAGHVTTGIWKLVVAVGLSVGMAVVLGGSALRITAAALVIALAINVTNAMDVRPGRALKWAGLWLLPVSFLAVSSRLEAGTSLAYAAYLGAGFGVLNLDLGERGMLGDAGSNPLGFILGTALAGFLPLLGLLVVLLVLAGLQVAAETVTISRLIEAVPPARWFDLLGRRN